LLPAAVRDYVMGLPHPAGLIGCRASGGSLECCEYDIAVFADGTDSVVQAGGHTVELLHLGRSPRKHIASLKDMEIIKDDRSFVLSSAMQDFGPEKRARALKTSGRKLLVNSLMCQQRTKDARQQTVAAMWLKIAAYNFVQGTLAAAGTRPMPLHELAQARQAPLAADAADGVQVALECIGIERATRPAIARSSEAVAELKSRDHDRGLVQSKAAHLLDKSMLADCYYYLGRVASDSLAGRSGAFHAKYAKLVQISLDLSSDTQQLEKLQKSLFRAAKKGLK
jgi:hypothetical protein